MVIASRKLPACEAVRDALIAGGHEAIAVACNVSRRPEVDALVDATLQAWGGIDIVVANAAANPHYGALSTITDELWEKTITANVTSILWLANRALPIVAERGGGSLILMSSISAFLGTARLGAYAVTKAAEVQLARSLAVEWGARGVRVNAIAPGVIQTEFARALWEEPERRKRLERATCLKRVGVPDDIGGVAVFLASEAGRYVTGQTLVVDGGASITSAIE